MIKQYLRWKDQRHVRVQWLICLTENALFFGIGFFIFEYWDIFGFGERWESDRFMFQVGFMAVFWTLSNNWNLTRQLFVSNKKPQGND